MQLKYKLIAQIDDLLKQLDHIELDDNFDTSGIQKNIEELSELLSRLKSNNPDADTKLIPNSYD